MAERAAPSQVGKPAAEGPVSKFCMGETSRLGEHFPDEVRAVTPSVRLRRVMSSARTPV